MESDDGFLARHKLFSGLSKDQFSLIANLAKVEEFAEDDIICHEGEAADKIYIIAQGEVDILKTKDNSENVYTIVTLGPGSIIGEISFINRSLYTATVKAVSPLKIFSLSFDKLDAIKHDNTAANRLIYYQLIENIAHELSLRICRTNQILVDLMHSSKTEHDIRNAKMTLFAGFWSM